MKRLEAKSMVLLKHHLKALRLPTIGAECEKVAGQAASKLGLLAMGRSATFSPEHCGQNRQRFPRGQAVVELRFVLSRYGQNSMRGDLPRQVFHANLPWEEGERTGLSISTQTHQLYMPVM